MSILNEAFEELHPYQVHSELADHITSAVEQVELYHVTRQMHIPTI
jgi:hypothetical protein